MSKHKDQQSTSVSISVDVSKIVRNACIAGVVIVAIVFGCSACRKLTACDEPEGPAAEA